METGSLNLGLEQSIQLDTETMVYIRRHLDEPVQIVNDSKNNPACRQISNAMGDAAVSVLVLKLIGTMLLSANGYRRYNREHAGLLSLLHDPFAVAMSNTLKHQEVTRLKDQLMDDNRYLNDELHQMIGDKIIGRKTA